MSSFLGDRNFPRLNLYMLLIILFLLQCYTLTGVEVTIGGNYTKTVTDASAYKSIMFARFGEYADLFVDSTTNSNMVKLFKENGFSSFRFHHPDESFWSRPNDNIWRDQIIGTYSTKPFDFIIPDLEFIEWATKHGFKVIFQVNIKLYFDPVTQTVYPLDRHPQFIDVAAQYQAGLVRLVKDRQLSDTILYWELGNESYNPGGKVNGERIEGFTPSEVAAINAVFIRAMRQADPMIKIAIDGQAPDHPRKIKFKDFDGTVGEWHQQFLWQLSQLGVKDGDFNYLSQHCYAHWIQDVPFDYPKVQPPPIDQTWSQLKRPVISQIGTVDANLALLRSLGYYQVTIQVNEVKRGASRMWYNRTMMHALAQADPLFYFIQHPGVSGSVIHDAFNNGANALAAEPWRKATLGWGIFIPKPDGTFIASPLAIMYQLYARLLADGDLVLQVSGDVLTVATYGNGKLKILAVNKEDEEQDVNFRFEGIQLPPDAKVNVYTLNSDKLDAFPVDPITKQQKNFEVKTFTFIAKGGNLSHPLPRYSYLLLEIDQVKLDRPTKVPFVYQMASEKPQTEDGKDFYETIVPELTPDSRTVLFIDFAKSSPEAVQKAYPSLKFQWNQITSADFTHEGLQLDGEMFFTVGKLATPTDRLEMAAVFKPDTGLVNAIVMAQNFHFTALGIWNQSLYADIQTDQGRYRYHHAGKYTPGRWCLMQVSYDQNQVKTLVNGKEVHTQGLTGSIITTPLTVGATANQQKERFRGIIRQIKISKPE